MPIGFSGDPINLNSCDLIFRTIGCPIRVVGGDDIGAAFGVMKRGINNTRLHPVRQVGCQYSVASATLYLDQIAIDNAAIFGIMRVNFQYIFIMPVDVRGSAGLCADIILRKNPTRR